MVGSAFVQEEGIEKETSDLFDNSAFSHLYRQDHREMVGVMAQESRCEQVGGESRCYYHSCLQARTQIHGFQQLCLGGSLAEEEWNCSRVPRP
jgi:hypothetical protein